MLIHISERTVRHIWRVADGEIAFVNSRSGTGTELHLFNMANGTASKIQAIPSIVNGVFPAGELLVCVEANDSNLLLVVRARRDFKIVRQRVIQPIEPCFSFASLDEQSHRIYLLRRDLLPRSSVTKIDVFDWKTLDSLQTEISIPDDPLIGEILGVHSISDRMILITESGLAVFADGGNDLQQVHQLIGTANVTAKCCGRFGVCSDAPKSVEIFRFDPFCTRMLSIDACPKFKEVLSVDLCDEGDYIFVTLAFRAMHSSDSFFIQFKIDPSDLTIVAPTF